MKTMGLFGYDKDAVRVMMDEGEQIMRQQQAQISKLTAENREFARQLEDAGRDRRRLDAEKERAEQDAEAAEEAAADLERRLDAAELSNQALEEELAELRHEADDHRIRAAEAERNCARLERDLAAKTRQLQDARASLAARQDELEREREHRLSLELKLSEAMGVVRGLSHQGADANRATKADRRELMKGQAALARGAKTDLSDEARVAALSEAKRILGELPPDLEDDFSRLRRRLSG
jgi:chromosome segregation ATPase